MQANIRFSQRSKAGDNFAKAGRNILTKTLNKNSSMHEGHTGDYYDKTYAY